MYNFRHVYNVLYCVKQMEIPGSGVVNRYIAAQGPLPNTCRDFWQMIWEQQCRLVVMLTTKVSHYKQYVAGVAPEMTKCHHRLYTSVISSTCLNVVTINYRTLK